MTWLDIDHGIGENLQSKCKIDPWTLGPVSPICRKLVLIPLKETSRQTFRDVLAFRPAQPLLDAVPAGYRNSAGPPGLLKIWRRQNSSNNEIQSNRNRNIARHRFRRSPRFGRTTDGMLACHEVKLLGALMRSGVRKVYRIMPGFLILTWRLFDIIAFCRATQSFGGTTWNCLAMVACSSIL